MNQEVSAPSENVFLSTHGIPIRNIWLLLLYASDLFSEVLHKKQQMDKEDAPEDIPNIIAEILVHFVRERLLRGLTQSYQPKESDLHRVRGRIDMLRTAGHQLLDHGLVACRFQEPTHNTPRNRLIKAALDKGAILASGLIARTCRDYSALMYRMGVTGGHPDRTTLSKETDTINNRDDRQALAAAKLLLDMALPNCRSGNEYLLLPDMDEVWLRKLFEHAVRGFYRVKASDEWDVAKENIGQKWPIQQGKGEIESYFPSMKLDIVMRNRNDQRRVVIDTKFTNVLKSGWYRKESLTTGYIYQMYAYLRSQEENADHSYRNATGVLLHPALDKCHRLSCVIQGHKIIFATVNLNASAKEICDELQELLNEC